MTSTHAGAARLRIGQVAARVGVTTRTIRYYEERGLLAADPAHLKGAHRLYGEADIARLRELIRLRDLLGLSLEEIATLVDSEEACAALRDQWAESLSEPERTRILDTAIAHLERQLELIQGRQHTLAELAGELARKLRSMQSRRAALRPQSSPQQR